MFIAHETDGFLLYSGNNHIVGLQAINYARYYAAACQRNNDNSAILSTKEVL